MTLTFNLLAEPGTSGEVSGPLAELAHSLGRHFGSPAKPRYGTRELDPPNRLLYLLDHEYTQRGLSWERLKGADAGRAALPRAAAEQAGCESVLALAEVKETWDAHPEGEDPWDDYGYDEDDEEGGGDASEDGDYVLQELVDDEITLGWWTDPDGTGGEEISLWVHDYEVCASTANADLTPYDSQYEGYMGNYGNTLDRWYRRAAVVVWPRERACAARGEAGLRWALEELRVVIARGDVDRARDHARSLAPFWKSIRPQPDLLDSALRVAAGLDAAETAAMLLEPFQAGALGPEHADGLATVAERYGTGWMRRVVDAWFASEHHHLQSMRYEWPERLPELCAKLREHRASAVARLLSAGVWAAVDSGLGLWTTTGPAGTRSRRLRQLALPLGHVLAAADEELRDGILAALRECGDTVLECLMPLLRHAAEASTSSVWGAAGLDAIARHCADRLRAVCERAPRAADDWSVAWSGCGCELCRALGAFLGSRSRQVLEWPLAKEGRRHVHTRIDSAELPVRHSVGDVLSGAGYALEDVGETALSDLASIGNAMAHDAGAVTEVLGGIGLATLGAGGEIAGLVLDASGIGTLLGVPPPSYRPPRSPVGWALRVSERAPSRTTRQDRTVSTCPPTGGRAAKATGTPPLRTFTPVPRTSRIPMPHRADAVLPSTTATPRRTSWPAAGERDCRYPGQIGLRRGAEP